MKTFAHRGWSAGEEENTLSAFEKSVASGLDGAEFDVRLSADGRSIILSHDRTNDNSVLRLDDTLKYLKETEMELFIEVKEYSEKLFELLVEHLRQYGLVERATIFGFPKDAKLFPWTTRQDIKLGIIAPYPQDIRKYIETYNPEMVLLGWGNKKERLQFKIAWTFLSLKRIFTKYPLVKFVIGVAYTEKDKQWLSRQFGLYGITADLPLR